MLFNDTDDFGPKTVVAIDPTGLRGSLVINPLNQANNQVIYSPDGQFDTLRAGQTATEIFKYTVSDGIGSSVGTVTVTITGVNDAPIANIDPNGYRVVRGGTLNANDASGQSNGPGDDGVLLNDADAEGDALRALVVTRPQYATAGGFTLNANGTFTYRHNGGASSFDTFTYQAVDINGAVSQQIVTVVISIVESTPSDWQNPILRYDVNNDSAVSPIDALLLINYINAQASPPPPLPDPRPVGAPFYDVNGDDFATAEDVLAVINEINRLNSPSGGEGEGILASAESATEFKTVSSIAAAQAVTAAPTAELLAPLTSAFATALEPSRGVPLENAGRTTPTSERTRTAPRQTAEPATVRIDRYDLEDVLDSIADDVGGSFANATALDEVLAEILG